MGPVCKYDTLTNELITLLSRRPAPPNHWSQAWIDVELGTALAAAGNTSAAVATLERSLVINGDMDHPLTGAALLQLGLLALDGGDFVRAGQYFREATFVTASFSAQPMGFSDPGLLEEALRYGQLVHLMTNQPNVNPTLGPALTWVRNRGFAYLQGSLAVSLAENWALLGEKPAATTELGEARNLAGHGPMADSDLGARFNMVAALMGYQSGQLSAGEAPLHQALNYQQSGSLWMFQIRTVDNLYLSGVLNDRVAAQLYELLLRDPTPVDWAASPLESLSVLVNPHPTSYEHWFEATLQAAARMPELALEIADRTRRHRYLSSLPLGGRLLGLRWMLEGPKELLNDQVLLQRQELLTKFPHYSDLAEDEKKLFADLTAAPVVDDAADARREQARRLSEMASLGESQEAILREIAVRREPADLVFPPLRKTKDLQQALPEGHLLLAFFATSNDNLYGFLFSKDKYTTWTVTSPAAVNLHMIAMLRDMGNTDHNRQVSLQDLARTSWKKSAGQADRSPVRQIECRSVGQIRRTDHRSRRSTLVLAVRGPADRRRPEDRSATDLASPRTLRPHHGPGDSLSTFGQARAQADGCGFGKTLSARRRHGGPDGLREAGAFRDPHGGAAAQPTGPFVDDADLDRRIDRAG